MEESGARVIDFEKVCRLCLHEKRVLTEIFESSLENNNLSIDQKIMACAAVDLSKDDGMPGKICIKCLANLNTAFDFRVQCENADRTLHEIHKVLTSNGVKTDGKEIERERVKVNEEVDKDKEDSQVKKSVVLSHVIVIKQEEKNVSLEDPGDVLHVVKDSVKDIKSKEISLADILIDSLEPPLQVEETKTPEEVPNEISFTIQGNSEDTYRVIINPPTDEPQVNDLKLKGKRKGDGDISAKSPCPFCNKMLSRVDEHIRLFHRNRVYVCTKHNCGAEFLTLKNLQSHQLRCYNMEKGYKCLRCCKEFHRKSNYKAHIRRHSDVKDFQCQLCDRAFVDSTGLRRHFLKHHEPQQETFVSGCCGKRFKSKEGLKKHIQRSICGIQMFHVLASESMEVTALEPS